MSEAKIKTLANCKPSEFLRQSNKIRNKVAEWITLTDLMNIRKELPEIPEGATKEETKKLYDEQAMKNFSKILDSALEEHPDETLEVIALCCFIEPEKADDYPTTFYLNAIGELVNDEGVKNFLLSLMRLA